MSSVMPIGNRERGEAGERLVRVVADVLQELVNSPRPPAANDPATGAPYASSSSTMGLTKFHGLRTPTIGLSEYLLRISKFSGCSDECFVLALIYIDRLITKKGVFLDQRNVHRLVVTSVMLSAKFFDDHYLDNAHYSAVGGVPAIEMNQLELEFLFLLEFQLHVTGSDYDLYRRALDQKHDARTMIPPSPSPPQLQQQEQQQQQMEYSAHHRQQQQQQQIQHQQQPSYESGYNPYQSQQHPKHVHPSTQNQQAYLQQRRMRSMGTPGVPQGGGQSGSAQADVDEITSYDVMVE